MSDENNSPPDSGRPRRASITSNTFTALFGRSNSTSSPSSTTTGVAPQPGPIATAAAPGRRMSIATVGLSGTSPTQTPGFGFPGARRGSVSTAGSDSIDENAIDDDDGPGPARSVPTTPFTRRMSFGAQALFNARGSGGQGTTAEGLNWSEQFRSRAESAVQRPPFGTNATNMVPRSPTAPAHERTKSFGDMPAPPTASIPAPAQPSALRRKPDAVGERILRGDFYMD